MVMKPKKSNTLFHYDDRARECVITTPSTPVPWYHYLSNENYGAQCSQVAGGFSLFPIIEGRRLIHADRDGAPGRRVYVKDLEDGSVWTLNHPSGTRVPYECRHGLGYSRITSRQHGIEGTLKILVVPDDPAEIWTISLTNLSGRKRCLAFYPFVEWSLGGNLALWDEPAWYTRTNYVPREGAVIARLLDPKRMGNEYRAFMAPFFKVNGYACHRAAFLGPRCDLDAPEALNRPDLPCLPANGEPTIGVVEHRLELAPGNRKHFDLLLGYGETPRRLRAIMRRYRPAAARRRAMQKVSTYWDEIAARHTVKTPDASFNRWMNVWIKYQEIQSHRWVGGGAANCPLMGFRDVLQHVMGMVLFDPAAARARFLEALRYQYRNGRTVRGWSRSGAHDTRDYRDCPVWIIFALTSYLKETGDFGLLEEVVPFLDKGEAPVLSHAQAALKAYVNDRGAHGLSHIGEGDWLDPLNRAGVKGRGESVWLSMAVHLALNQMAELKEFLGSPGQAARYRRDACSFCDSINRHGWDGEWYLQAYDDAGRLIGSRRNRAGRIFLMPQAWAVMSGVADPQRARQCMASADRQLRTEFGYRMWTPGYDRYDPALGGISILQMQSPVYSHSTVFKIIADCILGRGSEAHQTFMSITPDNPRNPPEQSWAPPHIIPNGYSTAREDGRWGRMCYYGFSGTFPWLLKAGLEWIGGVRAEYDGLRLAPSIPGTWPGMVVNRHFRGADYRIDIRRCSGAGSRADRADSRDQVVAPGALLPVISAGTTGRFRCVLDSAPSGEKIN